MKNLAQGGRHNGGLRRALTDDDVADARRRAALGESTVDLADDFGVSPQTMTRELFGHRGRPGVAVEPLDGRAGPRSGINVRRQMLAFLTRYIQGRGFAPSVREITAACGISSISVTAYHLRRMEQDGLIARDYGTARSIRVVDGAQGRARLAGRFVMPGDTVQVDVDGLVQHGAFVA